MSMDATEAANIVEELGLSLYRATNDTDALDDSLEVAEFIRESVKQPAVESGIPYTEGDTVVDENAPHWSDTPLVEVVAVTDELAADYMIDVDRTTKTVAHVNRDYPRDDNVVLARPLKSDETYAYPASRLNPQ